jgi:TolB-like protein/DNA-binding winged helix-turn-helix (wHTH) protein
VNRAGRIEIPGEIQLADEPELAVGRMIVRPATLEILFDGARETIEPRMMQLLVALARARGQVVSRDSLIVSCWGGRAVGDDAINRCVAKVRRLADGTAGFKIETINRVGYRLIETVSERAGTLLRAAPSVDPSAPRLDRRLLIGGAAAAAVAALGGLTIWGRRDANAPPQPTVASIGVTPFESDSAGDAALAIGLTDQVRAGLASRSDVQVVSVDLRDAAIGDDATAARRGQGLGLTYLIRGTVRHQQNRLSISVRLIESGSGRLAWSDDATAPVSDLGALQDRIAGGVASALGLRLAPRAATSISGEAEALYLTAKGLLRSRGRENAQTAALLLREAVDREPGFAAAWSRLATATILDRDEDAPLDPRRRDAALSYAHRALSLDPNLADAHGVIGLILGFRSEEAAAQIRRAAELDPNDPEIQLWRGHVYGGDLDFANQLAAYRRALQLDPLWLQASLQYVQTASDLGRRGDAEAEVRRYIHAADSIHSQAAMAWLALQRGQLAEAARRFAAIRRAGGSSRESASAYLALTLREAGLPAQARRVFPYPDDAWSIWYGDPPTAATLRQRLAVVDANSEDFVLAILAAKRLVAAGQAASIADLYFQPAGLFEISARRPPRPAPLVGGAATVALILRQAGRNADADALLARADAEIERARAAGPVGAIFNFQAASVWALLGRREAALGALEQAVETGLSVHLDSAALADIGDEPAFAGIRSDPRFLRLRARIAAHIASERLQIQQTLVLP